MGPQNTKTSTQTVCTPCSSNIGNQFRDSAAMCFRSFCSLALNMRPEVEGLSAVHRDAWGRFDMFHQIGCAGNSACPGSCETRDGREETCLIDIAKADSDVHSNYKRPPWFGDLPFTKLKNNVLCEHAPCSEQVHLQIGGVNEMVVSFVSSVESHAGPYVFYWEETMGSCSDASSRRNATGTTEQYSLLMYFSHQLWLGSIRLTAFGVCSMMFHSL